MCAPNVTEAELPARSLLGDRIVSGDFVDCYSVASDASPRRAAEIITDFPGWARFLMRVRGILTVPFGLSNDGPEAEDKLGVFPVEADTENELIAGFNDRHLDFRISVLSRKGRVYLATWVHPHNIGGRFYLKAILPFHVLIARNALRRVAGAPTRA
jgi:hypothetical protein